MINHPQTSIANMRKAFRTLSAEIEADTELVIADIQRLSRAEVDLHDLFKKSEREEAAIIQIQDNIVNTSEKCFAYIRKFETLKSFTLHAKKIEKPKVVMQVQKAIGKLVPDMEHSEQDIILLMKDFTSIVDLTADALINVRFVVEERLHKDDIPSMIAKLGDIKEMLEE